MDAELNLSFQYFAKSAECLLILCTFAFNFISGDEYFDFIFLFLFVNLIISRERQKER